MDEWIIMIMIIYHYFHHYRCIKIELWKLDL